jgi:glycogen synthase
MNTGGLHDTVEHLDIASETGNGFVFDHYDPYGLSWGIDQAINFYQQPMELKRKTISRVMRTAKERFNHDRTAGEYIKIYEDMLQKPLINHF